MAETPVVRAGREADAAALAELGRAVVPATYGPISEAEAVRTLETWWSEDALAESLRRIPHWVAEDADGRLVGISNLGSRGERRVMWKLYVHPDHHGRGIGSRLLAEVEARVEGDELWLEVVDGNEQAFGFYRARGFEEQERTPDDGPWPDDVWMMKVLR